MVLSQGNATVPLTLLLPKQRGNSLELSVVDKETVPLVAPFRGKVKLRRVSLLQIFHARDRRCQEVFAREDESGS